MVHQSICCSVCACIPCIKVNVQGCCGGLHMACNGIAFSCIQCAIIMSHTASAYVPAGKHHCPHPCIDIGYGASANSKLASDDSQFCLWLVIALTLLHILKLALQKIYKTDMTDSGCITGKCPSSLKADSETFLWMSPALSASTWYLRYQA